MVLSVATLFAAYSTASGAPPSAPANRPAQTPAAISKGPDKVELVYFHSKNPCPCMAAVGNNIKYAVDTYFKSETANGKIKLTMIVYDDPANAGLVKQYDAMRFALFIREIRGSKERLYPVDSIWEMMGDDTGIKLVQFIKSTITGLLEGKS